MDFKKYILDHPQKAKIFLHIYNGVFGRNKKNINRENKLDIQSAYCSRTKIYVHGKGNTIYIGNAVRLMNCSIYISGNNNLVEISDNVSLNQAEFHIEDNENKIIIGKGTSVTGKTHFAAIESTSITIGEDCMFANDIHFRTGDSHSLVDLSGKRINYSKDIVIENHVWVGMNVICLKGTTVKSNTMIGAGSLLNGEYSSENCILAGSPARIVKNNINWLRERVL